MVIVLAVMAVSLVLASTAGGTKASPQSSKAQARVAIPSSAKQVAPGVYYLGEATDKGKVVEGYAFVKYQRKEGRGKPGTECGNGICEPGENARKCPDDCGGGEPDPDPEETCYGFLAKGAKWKTVEDYLVDAESSEDLDAAFVSENVAFNIAKWEDAADGLLDGNITKDILGNEVGGVVDGVDWDSPDDKNELYFGDIEEPGVIAMAVVWGTFSAPPGLRQLVEWDHVYDQVDFVWSSTGEPGKMDFENIATHELGHSVGLADLYETACSEQTM